jgi:hypothetical protein
MTIMIPVKDFYEHEVDLPELGAVSSPRLPLHCLSRGYGGWCGDGDCCECGHSLASVVYLSLASTDCQLFSIFRQIPNRVRVVIEGYLVLLLLAKASRFPGIGCWT